VALTVRSGRGAAVGVVAKGVNVESTLSIGVVASDIPGDGSGSRLRLLLENDGAANLGVASENRNCRRNKALVHDPWDLLLARKIASHQGTVEIG
jgi:hypothetical protein